MSQVQSNYLRWEAHTCLPLHPQASFAPIEQLRQLGVNYASINIGMDMNPLSQVMKVIASFRAQIFAASDRIVLARTVADIESARAAGKIAVGFDLEGAIPLLDQPEMVALMHDLGVNQMHFAYNRNNSVADGCHDVERGLTALGKRMVHAVNAAGVLMDCSHTGRRCSLEIMAESNQPVIFSHANPLKLAEHGRNITDEQIKACAGTGGVICVSGVSRFLGNDQPGSADLARHAAYLADLVGIDHVGIGIDTSFRQPELNDNPPDEPNKPYDPSYWWPASAGYMRAIAPMTYAPISSWQTLPTDLAAVGMGEADIAKVLGKNMMRVARSVWR
jgi:membrane dipeptidase